MNLARIMADRGFNQVELADKSGVSQQLISSYLREGPQAKGPNLRNLVALARALHCTLEDLTGMESLKGTEEKVAEHQPSERALAFAEALEKLPEDDPRRKAIELLLLEEIHKTKEDEPQDHSGDTDVKEG